MPLNLSNVFLWNNVVIESFAERRIGQEEMERWTNIFRKFLAAIEYIHKRKDDDFMRVSKELDAMEEDLEEIKKKSLSGLLGFTSPDYENAVVFAFGRLYKYLESELASLIGESNFDRVKFKSGCPEAVAVKGTKKLTMEFETSSSNFKKHNHKETECDLIVCWRHDWRECPVNVLELRELLMYEP